MVTIFIEKNFENKDFSTCRSKRIRSRVNLKSINILSFFISASHNAVNPTQDFKTVLYQRDINLHNINANMGIDLNF